MKKTLKHQLEVRGIKYPFSHDIDVLLGTSEELTDGLPVEIRLNIATINKWESATRNAKDYVASLRDIEKVAPFILKYYEDAVEVEAEAKRVEAETKRVEDVDTTSEFSENK